MDPSPKIHFAEKKASPFYRELRSRVATYFDERGEDRFANTAFFLKGALFLVTYFGAYSLVLLGGFSWPVMLALGVAMALSGVCIVFNIVHDASHHAIFKNRRYNKLVALLGDLVGINTYIWDIRHNVQHHTFTNVLGGDIIIEQVPLLRLSPHQPWRPFHRFQWLYAPLMYGLYTLYWIFGIDFRLFAQKNICNLRNLRHPRREWVKLIVFKLLFVFYMIVVPIWVLPLPWYAVVGGFLLMHVVAGWLLSIVAVLGHFVEGPAFPQPDARGEIANSWGDHELDATIDFANRSRLAHALTGGLNTHIAHHLFPHVCHIHYYRLTPIIREVAQRYGMPYREESFAAAVKSHWTYLRAMGRGAAIEHPNARLAV